MEYRSLFAAILTAGAPFWVILYRFWSGWRNALAVVSPDTVHGAVTL